MLQHAACSMQHAARVGTYSLHEQGLAADADRLLDVARTWRHEELHESGEPGWGEPSPGADVATVRPRPGADVDGVSPVPVQMRVRWAQSWCSCGTYLAMRGATSASASFPSQPSRHSSAT